MRVAVFAEAAGHPAERPWLRQLSSFHLREAAAVGGRGDLLPEAWPAREGTKTRNTGSPGSQPGPGLQMFTHSPQTLFL